MTRPKYERDLTDAEIDIVRMIAQGRTDGQIALILGLKIGTLRSRINAIYHRLGIPVGPGRPGSTAGLTRLLLAVWAYENGIVVPKASAPRDPELTVRAFAVCRALVYRRPIPLVRDEAVAIIREADADLCADAA